MFLYRILLLIIAAQRKLIVKFCNKLYVFLPRFKKFFPFFESLVNNTQKIICQGRSFFKFFLIPVLLNQLSFPNFHFQPFQLISKKRITISATDLRIRTKKLCEKFWEVAWKRLFFKAEGINGILKLSFTLYEAVDAFFEFSNRIVINRLIYVNLWFSQPELRFFEFLASDLFQLLAELFVSCNKIGAFPQNFNTFLLHFEQFFIMWVVDFI